MDLKLLHNINGLLMNRLPALHFELLSDFGVSSAHDDTHVSNTLLDGSNTQSIQDTAEFLPDQGITPIKNWRKSDTKYIQYTTFVITLLG